MARKQGINDDVREKIKNLENRCKITIKKIEDDNKRLYADHESNGFERCIKVNINNERIKRIKELFKEVCEESGYKC